MGEALVKRVKTGDFKESELWCLSRLGARKLFYGPINLVVPPATVVRWVETLLKVAAAGALIGQVMKEMKGQADAGKARELILAKLQ